MSLWEGQDAKAMFKQQFRRVKLLGEGAFGAAYLVQQRDNEEMFHVAKEIKVNHLTEKERDGALDESKLLSSISHPNIVAYRASFIDANKLYIVMEYANGGDLAHKIRERKEEKRNFSEQKIMCYFVQIADALQHIHSRKILHRDLKPMNIFLTRDGYVKLGDFGIARVLESSTAGAQTTIGTPFYLSPEQCNSEPYGLKSDLWSLGVVTYELAALRVPFHAPSLPAVAMQICNASYDPLPKQYSRGLTKIIRQLLEKEPAARPKLSDVLWVPYVRQYVEYLMCHPQEGLVSNASTSEEWARTDGHEMSAGMGQKTRDGHDVGTPMGRDAGTPSRDAGTPSRRDMRDARAQDDRDRRRELQEQQRHAAQEAARDQYFENQRRAQEIRRRANDGFQMDDGSGTASGGLQVPEDGGMSSRRSQRRPSYREEQMEAKQREQRDLERAYREAEEDRRIARQRKMAEAWQSQSMHRDEEDRGCDASPAEWQDEGRGSSRMSAEEQHRAALDRAHRQAAEDRRLAWQRKQANEAAERSAQAEVVASTPAAADWRGHAEPHPELPEASNFGSPAGVSKRSGTDDDKWQQLERARQEHLEDRRRLLEKYGKGERDDEEQSTAAPTESDAQLSDVLVFDFRGSSTRDSKQSPLGSSAGSRESPKDMLRPPRESPKDGSRGQPRESPTAREDLPARRGSFRGGLRESPKDAPREDLSARRGSFRTPPRGSPGRPPDAQAAAADAGPTFGDRVSAEREPDRPQRWRPENWPDASAEASASRVSDTRQGASNRQVAKAASQAKGSKTDRSDTEARRQATLEEARVRAGIEANNKLADRQREREAQRQQFFRNRNSVLASKRRSNPDVAVFWPGPANADPQQVDQADVLDDTPHAMEGHGEERGFPDEALRRPESAGSEHQAVEDEGMLTFSSGGSPLDSAEIMPSRREVPNSDATPPGSDASSPMRQSSGRSLISPSRSNASSQNPLLANSRGKYLRDDGMSTAQARELAEELFNPKAASPMKSPLRSPASKAGSPVLMNSNGEQILQHQRAAREFAEAESEERAEFVTFGGLSPGRPVASPSKFPLKSASREVQEAYQDVRELMQELQGDDEHIAPSGKSSKPPRTHQRSSDSERGVLTAAFGESLSGRSEVADVLVDGAGANSDDHQEADDAEEREDHEEGEEEEAEEWEEFEMEQEESEETKAAVQPQTDIFASHETY